MGNPFGSAKPRPVVIPPPDPLPPPPERSDAETAALADQQRKKLQGGSGRASNFLTASGTTGATSAVRFLGGAART